MIRMAALLGHYMPMENAGIEPDQDAERTPTAPANISMTLRCFDTEENARRFGNLIAMWVRELSRTIDLTDLDGITIAYDYNQALLDLDRGYPTSHKLTPSEEFAFGVAMTPAVMRDGKVKSHIVLNGGVIRPLEDEKHEAFRLAIHTLAHECAHVEVTKRFNDAFPGVLLQTKAPSVHQHCRWEIIKSCWDEYAVTQICATFGEDPTAGYEETFLSVLKATRPKAIRLIQEYRLHQNLEQIVPEIYGAYGTLMKFASYHLGNMAGCGLSVNDLPNTKAALDGHWFQPHFERLAEVCRAIDGDYGVWKDRSQFEALGDLADAVVKDGGMILSNFTPNGGFYVDIPITPETIPDLTL